MNYQNRFFTFSDNTKFDFINLIILLLISIIVFKIVGGSPIIGIWESNYIYNNYASQDNQFNIFSISPRANIGDYGYGTVALSRYILELFDLNISLISVRFISILYGFISIIFFYLICKRYFNKNSALISSILLMLNPVFHNYQYELSNLSVSFMFLIIFFERLQKIELHGIQYSSFTIIIPFIFVLIHYGIMRISIAAYFVSFLFYIYFIIKKKDFLNFLLFFFIIYFISCLILIFFDKNNYYLLNSLDILFPKGSENIFTDDYVQNKVGIYKILSININIYFETFINILTNNFVSTNVNLIKADFRYSLLNIFMFCIFLFGFILSIHNIFKFKNLKILLNLNLILIVCLVPSLFSSVNIEDGKYLSTLSTHRLFISLFPIYLFICFSINFFNNKIINKKIYFLSALILILINFYFLNSEKKDMNYKISESINFNNNIKEIYGVYLDKNNYEYLKLQAEYIDIANIICSKDHNKNTVLKVNLNSFKSGIPNPRSLRNLKYYNYHSIFLSLYVNNICSKNVSWINVYDKQPKQIEFNFTNKLYYFAKLSYLINEYSNKNLKFEMKNFNQKTENIIIVTTKKEENFIKKYYSDLKIDYRIENIK